MAVSQQEVLLAYRHLYQHLLRAVKYSKPARFIARDRIRSAFRTTPREAYNAQRIARTLTFLDGASKFVGLEHRILKNWISVWADREGRLAPRLRANEWIMSRSMYARFDQTVEKLNETMGLCIK